MIDTDPWLNKSVCSFNSSASVPAKSSNIEFGVSSVMPVSSSPMNSDAYLFQSFSSESDAIGLKRPTELAFELAR